MKLVLLTKGSYFGEYEINNSIEKRVMTAKCKSFAQVASMNQEVYYLQFIIII